MSSLYVYDLLLLICGELNTPNLIKCKLISITHQNIIINGDWVNTPLYIGNDKMLSYVLDNYKFKNLDINPYCSTINANIYRLKKCHTLNISWSNITDENIQKLKGCYGLNVAGTNINNSTIKKLKNLNWIDLSITNVTDKCLEQLQNCEKLYLACTKITDKGVELLSKCHTLNLNGTKITDKSIIKLKNCHTLSLARTFISSKCANELCCFELVLYDTYVQRRTIKKLTVNGCTIHK